MKDLDLDALRGRWAGQGRALEAGLHVDAAALRVAIARRTRTGRRRQIGAVAARLVADGLLLVVLAVYASARLAEPHWLLMAIGVAAPVVAHFAAGFAQLRELHALDVTGPVPAAMAALARLRALRLRLARMIVVLSLLLWWPMLMLLADGLLGIDLFDVVHPSVVWTNVLAGAVFAPLAGGLLRWIGRRYGARPGMRAILDDTAGRGWVRLRDALQAGADGEGPEPASPRPVPAAAHAPLRRLHLRLWQVIAAAALAMLALGLFNAIHGGQPTAIVPGVLLNLVVVAQLAFSISNRAALAAAAVDADRLAPLLARLAAQRAALARTTLATAPLWLPALLQVLAKGLAGVDPAAAMPAGAGLVMLAGATALSVALLVAAARAPTRWPRRLVAIAAFGLTALADDARRRV